MGLNKNNNRRLLFRLAKNNLLSKKLSAFFSALSILLAVLLEIGRASCRERV